MSKKCLASALLACAAVPAILAAQDKPSPFGMNNAAPSIGVAAPVSSSPQVDSAAAPAAPVAPITPTASGPGSTDAGNAPAAPVPGPASAAAAAAPAKRASSSRDPFPEDVAAINDTELTWRLAQNRLEELGSGCMADGNQMIDQARDAKLKAVASYAKYYQDTLGYWTKARDTSGEAEMSSRTDSAELQAHVTQLQTELQSVNRRKADLDRTFGESHVDNAEEKAALEDLTRIQANKKEQLEKARAALDQNKAGHDWVVKRREYARTRVTEVNDLLQSTRTELYLYQQLYNAILYRHNLSCDREISRPIETTSDWRQDVKRLSPGAAE